ncbi:unnamed protein product [Allacma fusca]|uniref:Uncharacterized protein n=1 Tax=Allacma fusca TaxID=39272 RepID=A0A8J2LWJ8_9HEXA|nr:unnamed protein product [Allacma fusca]
MADFLSKTGGKNEEEATKRVLAEILSDSLASKLNWKGIVRKTNPSKIGLVTFRNFVILLKCAPRNYPKGPLSFPLACPKEITKQFCKSVRTEFKKLNPGVNQSTRSKQLDRDTCKRIGHNIPVTNLIVEKKLNRTSICVACTWPKVFKSKNNDMMDVKLEWDEYQSENHGLMSEVDRDIFLAKMGTLKALHDENVRNIFPAVAEAIKV